MAFPIGNNISSMRDELELTDGLGDRLGAADDGDPLDTASVASLPSHSSEDSSASSAVSDAARAADAEREWTESLQQLELLLTMVLVPYLGRYFGRKAAYWGWARFMEWKYPVDVVFTSPRTFKAVGLVEAAAAL